MDLGAAFVADEKSFHPVEPGEGAFHDPAAATSPEPCSVLRWAMIGSIPRSESWWRWGLES